VHEVGDLVPGGDARERPVDRELIGDVAADDVLARPQVEAARGQHDVAERGGV